MTGIGTTSIGRTIGMTGIGTTSIGRTTGMTIGNRGFRGLVSGHGGMYGGE